MLSSNMTRLLNLIEIRTGTKLLNLPDGMKKSDWAQVIEDITLSTFSRFFPNKILYEINTVTDAGPDGYYYIDEDRLPGVEILGVKDVSFDDLGKNSSMSAIAQGSYGVFDFFGSNAYTSMPQMAMAQLNADQMSLFDRGLYVDFIEPNKVCVKSATNQNIVKHMPSFKVWLLIKHANSLATIAPTMMETFEELAILDVKDFLYQSLKLYGDLETVFGTTNIKIDDWSSAASDRKDMVNQLREQYVSAANKNQPMIICV